jgi:hypothetical protein
MSETSKAATLVRASTDSPPFPDNLALVFHRENGRYQLCLLDSSGNAGDPVLEVEPSGGGNYNNPLANPGSGWATTAGWPIIAGYTKNP